MAALRCFGRTVPPGLIGELKPSDKTLSGATLRERLAEDGYLSIRGVVEPARVDAARAEVLGRLAEVGEVKEPVATGAASGSSRRQALHADLGAFWRSVCEGPALRSVSHGSALRALMDRILGGPVRAFDFLWLRAMTAGRASPLHFDCAYMGRGSARVLTVWLPLGPAPRSLGPLLIVEGSHRFLDLVEDYRRHDVDRDPSRPGHLPDNAIDLAEERRCRLLTADFAAGDAVIFPLFTLHGSFDNGAEDGRLRLSCDVRYQPAADPLDERWVGAPPPGHGGASYGGLAGARPLTAPPLSR